ncbi:4Fe-4S dicluster domain-containing protein [Escherichia coli]
MHCVDPNCVSVCPVSALKKDPKTGIVHYEACAPAAVTAWSPVPRTTCRSTTTTTRLVRCISASCATRKVWNVSIKAVCLAA